MTATRGSRGPLAGRRVLVTGTSGERIAKLLAARGAEPVVVPTIAVRPVASAELDEALAAAEEFAWIVLTSSSGVAAVFDRLRDLGIETPRAPRWAAVGPRTAAALEAEGVRVDHVPDRGVGVAIPAGMGEVRGKRVLLLRAAAAGADLPAGLRERGAFVVDVVAYETLEGPGSSGAALQRALNDGLDAAIFTSGSTARGFAALAGGPGSLAEAVVVCIGPSTAASAREAGFDPAGIASEPTPEGLVEALERATTTVEAAE